MTVSTGELAKMIMDIQQGKSDPPGEDAEHADARARLRAQIRDIVRAGGAVEVPGEME